MEPIFRQEYHMEAIHLDCFGRVKPSVLLHFAQEAAGDHCKQLALDWDRLAGRNMFWAVIRTRMQISRLPALDEKLTVETWPMPTTRVAFPRSTVGYDEKGNEVFRAISLWVLMDFSTRGMILPGKSGIDLAGTLRGNELATPSNLHLQTLGSHMLRRVGYSELDRNGHMNNTRYMDWVDDLLPASFHREHPAREITVCYLSEAREGEEMDITWSLSDGPCLQVEACRTQTEDPKQQTKIFTAQVLF